MRFALQPTVSSLEALSRCSLFSRITVEQLSALGSASRTMRFSTGQRIFERGSSVEHVFFLITGVVRRHVPSTDGGIKVVTLSDVPTVLNLAEVFSNRPYVSTAEAMSVTECLAVDVAAFQKLAQTDLSFAMRLIGVLADHQCIAESELATHASVPVTDRLLDYFLEQAGGYLNDSGETRLALLPTKKAVASRIGISAETLSRALSEFSKQGLLFIDRREIFIQNSPFNRYLRQRKAGTTPFIRTQAKGKTSAAGSLNESLVNRCGQQRMLAERVAANWTMVALGIRKPIVRAYLRRAAKRFELNLGELEAACGETDLQRSLARLREDWNASRGVMLYPSASEETANSAFRLSERILASAEVLTADAVSQSIFPNARFVDIAGRNRMLAVRALKLLIFGKWPYGRIEGIERFHQARLDLEQNIRALDDSLEPDALLANQLAILRRQWARYAEQLKQAEISPLDADALYAAYGGADQLLRHADTTVRLIETNPFLSASSQSASAGACHPI